MPLSGPPQVYDEGSLVASRPLNFVGSGVSAADNAAAGRVDVTIPGATGGSGISMPGVFTPKMYGAVGDGAADDTSAVQQAFDAARTYKATYGQGTILITPGIYRITSPIDVNGPSNDPFTGMALIGMGGFWNCVLRFDPPNTTGYSSTNPLTMLNWSHNNTNYEGWNLIENIWFQGPGSGATWGAKPCRCLNLTDETDWSTWPVGAGGPAYIDKGGHYFTTVRGCRFDNWQYAITGWGTLVNRFDNLIIENVWKGIYLEGRTALYNPGANANTFRDIRYVGCTEGSNSTGGAGNGLHIVGSMSTIDGGNFEFYQTAPGTGIGVSGAGYTGAIVLENGGEGGVTNISNIWFESGTAPTCIRLVTGNEPVNIHRNNLQGGDIKIGADYQGPVIVQENSGGGVTNFAPTGGAFVRPVRVQQNRNMIISNLAPSGFVSTDNF